MGSAVVTSKTIEYKGVFYKVSRRIWGIQLFGTSGPDQDPHYFWSYIDKSKVPDEVIKLSRK